MSAGTLKLYELPAEFAALDELLVESDGEITPVIEELMNHIELTFTEKVESVTAVIQHADAVRRSRED